MMSNAQTQPGWRASWPRKAMWIGAILLLVLPAIAMQLTPEVNWTLGDFVFAALLLFGAAGIVELAMRASSDLAYRAGVIVAVGAGFLTVWATGAVGMIGSEDDPYNRWFLGVVALALVGAMASSFRPRGLAVTMCLAAVAQVVAAVGGIAADPRGALFSAFFAGLWLLSAALFRTAASPEPSSRG